MTDRLSGPVATEGPRPAAVTDASSDTVSVLVRSMGRPSLSLALASIAQQTYRPLEVVVINASGLPHAALPDSLASGIECRLVDTEGPLPRAAAANRALQAAVGRWLMFVDDDDSIDPDHVERLRAALAQHPGTRVAHAGVRLVDADGQPCGLLDEPVDRLRLWLANRLAIHAVLFSRELVDAGLRFDECFTVYEDWDFWFRIATHERFVHVPGASATYRLVGSSGTAEAHAADTSQRLRQPFYRKWLPSISADELERLAAGAEHVRGDRDEALRLLHEAGMAAAAAQDQWQRELEDVRARAQAQGRQLSEALEHARGERERAEAARQQAEAARQQALAAYAELEQGYRALTASLSWRVTRPLRTMRRLVGAEGRVELLRHAWRTLPLGPQQRLAWRDWLLARGWGRSLARRFVPQVVAAPRPSPPPPTDKDRVRAEAESALTDFLAGSGRIDLSCRDAGPEVSVVVVLFNQAGLSRLCLQSLAASDGVSVETLIVDNGSTDRVPQLLDRVDGATLLRPGENLGFLRAVNLAAAQARGRYLVLLNNDAMLEPQTLRRAVDRLQADPGAGAVGGPILLWDGRLQEAGSIVWRDGSCQGYGRGDDPALPEYRFARDVDYCSGAFLMVRRALFDALGGLDPAFAPAYYEESDFCVRLWEHGQRIVYDPRVRIRHFEFASEVSPGWAIELQQRNRALFVTRHPAFLAGQCEPSTASLTRARARLAPGRQRVLMVDDRVPLPWLGQGYPRAASWVATMAAEGHAVTLYPLQFPREDWSDVRRALPETVEVMLDHGTAALADFLRARQGLYDTVVVSRPHNMQALRRLLEHEPALLGGARLVYDAEAMFSLRDIARAALDGRPLPEAERRRRIDAELALASGADVVVAVSEAEAAHYRAGSFRQVEVLGHTIDAVPATPGFAARHDLLFVGALTADDTPNSDSVRWFVAEVWPLVRAALGTGLRLHLVGDCEAPTVRALASADVIVHGRAELLAAHLDAARVFVVPTRYAAGIPHKAHEAAARGLPMVVTPLIAGQLGWGDFIAIGADAGAFARACIELLSDEQAWQRQREQLLAAVDRDCSKRAFRAAAARVLGV